ncbi:alpha-N-acetyl-neuraminyl-2,3-beta-galactosyl-1,3-N-acetyl-galactosaminide alpha-2,6-sialyltransferase isoform X1 [Latimeria chalumnae]|uniref:ST6 N-acetylgalactosaminide alpha-2,6-sialyltransferase 4 n=1 Tax=Latimeria chalumnae TaxID=7897 RepID=M3XKX0_LATCH|nr:PREDICTED: alpha-N-acetyl-neuraminyl-2,3-beta-galactosyl-1,3-N-acetyl-galactosaminide alpha-2,6-sialyltransferase isoform X2 [Latimeria chalumnae]|eukprot:XP_014342306.1 PREDICTED: alpha-N-acetyl-neuraminyl-2,3-beta-galactosyl-1,3-N-acetyl-galactosaminide alpha-2,6-sialyltransferase isoform X2 [Latimeria chalumnae]
MNNLRIFRLAMLFLVSLLFLWYFRFFQLINNLRIRYSILRRPVSPVMTLSQPPIPWGYISMYPEKLPLKLHCRECALVSSSGQMLGARKGRDIDQTECVIRMNNAPTVTYEEDVGGRTTIRVVAHSSVPLLLRNQNYYFEQMKGVHYVFFGPLEKMNEEKLGVIYVSLLKIAQRFSDAKLYMLTPEKRFHFTMVLWDEYGKDRAQTTKPWPSTGWIAMMLAVEMCDNILVYGMVSGRNCRKPNHLPIPYHYYGKQKLEECKMYKAHENAPQGKHRFITEKSIFKRWAKHYNITFVYPQWDEME